MNHEHSQKARPTGEGMRPPQSNGIACNSPGSNTTQLAACSQLATNQQQVTAGVFHGFLQLYITLETSFFLFLFHFFFLFFLRFLVATEVGHVALRVTSKGHQEFVDLHHRVMLVRWDPPVEADSMREKPTQVIQQKVILGNNLFYDFSGPTTRLLFHLLSAHGVCVFEQYPKPMATSLVMVLRCSLQLQFPIESIDLGDAMQQPNRSIGWFSF